MSHLKIKLVKRFIKFATTLSNCDKPHLRYLHELQKCDSRSVYGRNCRNICKEAEVHDIKDASHLDIKYEMINPEQEYKLSLISELIEMRAGRLDCNLTKKEVQVMLDNLCSD